MPKATFYTKSNCPLCDRAARLATPIAERYGWTLYAVDITSSKELFQEYGHRIPVIATDDRSIEGRITPEQVISLFAPARAPKLDG